MAGVIVTPGKLGAPFVGVQRPFAFPAPAAGADIVFTLPPGAWWRLLTASLPLTTSAVVGSRQVRVGFGDDTVQYGPWVASTTIAASLSATTVITPGLVTTSTPAVPALMHVPFPDVVLPGGWSIRTTTIAKDVGDQFGVSSWLFEEMDLGPLGGAYGLLPFADASTGAEGG